MPSTVRCVVGEIWRRGGEEKAGGVDRLRWRETRPRPTSKKGADPKWEKVGNMNTRSKMAVGNVARALVTPDGPPVKFNEPPLQPFPTSRKASRFPSENMDPISNHLASGIATMNNAAISA